MSFPALKSDVLGATVEVKDAKGTVYAVKATDLSEGDKVATFEFEKAIDEKLFTGVWTVDGVEYDFDTAKKLQDIKDASTDLKLLTALEAADIKNINEDLVSTYKTEIGKAELDTLADVQKLVDDTNAANETAQGAKEKVLAILNAETQIQLSKALTSLERVNADWIEDYEDAELIESVGSPAPPAVSLLAADKDDYNAITGTTAEEKLATIQGLIDDANLAQVATKYAAAEHGLDADAIATAQKLVDTYKVPVEEGEDDIYALFTDTLTYQSAIVTATKASTNSALLTALTKVDTLLKENTEKYEGKSFTATDVNGDTITESGFKNAADTFDLKQVRTDSASLTAYRTAIKAETNVGAKNQAKDLLKIIKLENAKALNELLKTLDTTETAYSAAATPTTAQTTAFLNALKAVAAYDTVTFKDVTIDDKRVADYATSVEALDLDKTATSGAKALVPAEATANSVLVKDAIEDVNGSAVTTALSKVTSAADASALLAALQDKELALKNVISANKDAYQTDATLLKTAATVGSGTAQSAQKALQKAVNQVNALVVINAAKTAADVQAQLGAFESTDYVDVATADRAIVAQLVLDARADATDKQFENVNAVSTVLEAAATDVNDALVYVNNGFEAETTSAIVTEFKTVGLIAADEDALEAATKVQTFKNSLTFTDTGKTSPAFKSLTEVKEALNK